MRRDDLLTLQVDGTQAPRSPAWRLLDPAPRNDAEAGVESRHAAADRLLRQLAGGAGERGYDNAFKVQWELFLRHVVEGGPFRWDLLEGAKGVQLAELG